MSGTSKAVSLQSADIDHWSGGTRVALSWTLEHPAEPDGAYRAKNVTITVHPNPGVILRGVEIHLLERDPRTGVLVSDIRRHLAWNGAAYATSFDWTSLPRIPEQELHVALKSSLADEPDARLKDPISRRFNFLVSLGA
jgi:hypothetical protein